MRYTVILIAILPWAVSEVSVAQDTTDEPPAPIRLFNGHDFENLHVYVDDPTTNPHDAWQVTDGLLRCTGVGRGFIRTQRAYADYRLHVEWRWPNGRGNSGVMFHIVGPDEIWPKCFEAQLATGRAGDVAMFWDARSQEEIVSRNPRGVSTGRLNRPGPTAERPLGEWNTYEIVAAGDEITLLVNGRQVNRMTRVLPSGGLIGLQAEGAAIDFRNITLTPLPPAKDLYAPMPP